MATISAALAYTQAKPQVDARPFTMLAARCKALASQETNAAELVKEKVRELSALKNEASEVTKKIGALASEGNLLTSDEAVKVLQDLVDQLKQTNERLGKVEEEVQHIMGWIEGQNEALPIMALDIQNLKRVGESNYVQFQWQDTEQNGNAIRNDGFQLRRVRISQKNKIADNIVAKISFDVATSSQRLSAELKDAFVTYEITPTVEHVGQEIVFGQQQLPLGYELERSSSEREFPERALYNRRLFAGERDRGILWRYGFAPGMMVHAGVWNGITVSDPQLTGVNTFRDIDNRVAASVGVRGYGTNYEWGISTLQATRPGFMPTGGGAAVPQVSRSIYFLDANYVGVLTEAVSVRGELMWGKDRDPIGGTANPTYRQQTNVFGWQAQITYNLNSSNQLHVRYDFYDPDTQDIVTTNNNIGTWGYGYTYWFNPGMKVTLSYELPREQGTQVRDNVWTVRAQVKL